MATPAHPLADEFPMLVPSRFRELVESVRRKWLTTNRIVCLGRLILDGRNRYLACLDAGQFGPDDLADDGLPPEGHRLWTSHFRRFVADQDGDPVDFVEAQNLPRRDLSDTQRAMIAARFANLRVGRPKAANSADVHYSEPKRTLQESADKYGISRRLVANAKSVLEHGAPALVEAVKSDEVSASTGAEIAGLSIEDQLAILDQRDPKGLREALRKHKASRAGRAVANSRVQAPDDLDYSPTPPWATRALLRVVFPHLRVSLDGKTVLEPACGEGHVSGVLLETDAAAVWASDIFDYSVDGVSPPGWVGERDYLAGEQAGEGVDWVITNPPFDKKAEAFAHRALAEAEVGVALFVRLGWLASNGRYERLFSVNPPTLVAIFAEDVPLHMGRWEPDGQTLSDYMWLVWVKGAEPQPTFWIPPGQRKALALADDVERFTANPVRMPAQRNAEVHARSEAISISKAEALETIRTRYTGDNGQQLADELGRPLNTIRKWAWEAGVSDRARLTLNAQRNLEKLNGEKELS